MNSLVSYGSSDSENEITDEEENIPTINAKQNGKSKQEYEILSNSVSSIKLPPSLRKIDELSQIEEEEDEFLHKREVPAAKPPSAPKPREKVKIMIPKLSDFEDEIDEDLKKKIPTASNKKTGLLGMLPKPCNYIGPAPKPISVEQKPSPSTITSIPQKTSQSAPSNEPQTKKIGFIPYALMDHKKLTDGKKTAKKKNNESDSDDEEENSTFFTFSSKDEDLPQVSEEEIKSLIEKEKNRIEQRKRQNDGTLDLESDLHEQESNSHYNQQQQPDIDKEAISALLGGNKAKRSKFDDIQIVDLSANDVLPDREEWMRKTLRGETSYIPTGKIDEKGPALGKRKGQLSYLANRAEKNMAELEAMWASNRQNNREARSKYGF